MKANTTQSCQGEYEGLSNLENERQGGPGWGPLLIWGSCASLELI